MLLDVGRHAGIRERLAQPCRLPATLLVLAEFLADLPQTLAQHRLLLPLVESGTGFLVDLPRDAQHLDTLAQKFQHDVQAFAQTESREHFLLLDGLEVQEACDQVHQRGNRLDAADRRGQLGGHLRQQLQRLHGQLAQPQTPRLDFRIQGGRLRMQLDARHPERLVLYELEHAEALLALTNEMVRAVRRGHVAHDARDRADAMQPFGLGIGLRRIALQQQSHPSVCLDCLLRARHRPLPADGNRQHQLWKQHRIAHR